MLVFRDVILDDTLWRKLRIRLGRPKRADIEVRKEMTSMEAVDAVMLGLEMVEQVPELYLEVDVRGSLERTVLVDEHEPGGEHVQVTAVEEEAYEGPSLACMRPIRSVQGER